MADNRFVDEDLDWLGEPEKEKSVPYSKKEELGIQLRAKRALGQMQKSSATDRRIFMQNCVDQLSNDGSDEDDARDVCEQLWEEGDTSQYEE